MRLAASAGILVGLAGCYYPYYYPYPPPPPPPRPVAAIHAPDAQMGTNVVAPVAPPQIVSETASPSPGPGYQWIAGFWTWNVNHYVWTGGHWETPRAGMHWVPRQWVQGPGGWQQLGGHWQAG
jgi:hypothetical protein